VDEKFLDFVLHLFLLFDFLTFFIDRNGRFQIRDFSYTSPQKVGQKKKKRKIDTYIDRKKDRKK
jgi:hypothetical protein